ncbi:MFS transporter [Aeromicrobium sp. 50.2.37]|uniref:MFS transporter n=1 Tax=Aeromicrobium sp. 50.2.37 TaxID=2969305 RepID=UPI002150309B|nr:MFS transporter [Aeromicrobium sp. 50.2.37]MCR4514635.1 MFS transporter [Aeromicrobium sp. 50.2.37]
MKRTFSLSVLLVPSGLGLVAATYGLVRLASGLYLPDVQADLGLGVATAGLVSSGASVVYCLGALAGLLLAARHARALVVAAAATAGGGAVGMALAPDVPTFALLAVLASAGAGLTSPAMVALLQQDPSTRARPAAQAAVNSGTGPGLVAAGALALLLLPDWRAAWAWSGLFTVLVAGVVLASARTVDRTSQGPASGVMPATWWVAHTRVVAAALLLGAGSAAVWSYGRAMLVDAGTGRTASVVAWVAVGVGGTLVVVSSRRMERIGPQASWVLTAGVVALATAALAVLPAVTPVALAACAAFGWGFVAASGALIVWTIEIDEARGASGTALLFVVLVLGQAVGSTVVGALVPVAGYAAAFLAAAGVCAVGGLVAVRARRATPEQRSSTAPSVR